MKRVVLVILASFALAFAAPVSAAPRDEPSPTAAAIGPTSWEQMNVLQKTFHCIVTPCGWVFKGLWYVFVWPFTDDMPATAKPEDGK